MKRIFIETFLGRWKTKILLSHFVSDSISRFLSTGEFPLAGHEVIDPYFLLFSSACWNGIALGAIDIAKKHVIRTDHADTGLRVADYPIIQVISIIDISSY